MNVPESREVIVQRISRDPRVVGYLRKDILMGIVDISEEFQIAEEVCDEYGIDVKTFGVGCDIARGEIDQDIFEGRAGLL